MYQDASLKLKRGDLKGAAAGADSGLRHFADPRTEWHWRFADLKAEVLVRQRSNKEALELLSPELPASLSSGDVAIWRELTRGSAYTYLLDFPNAETHLTQAETLAKASNPNLWGEVALRKGTLADLQGDRGSAQAEYREALQIANRVRDQFLEVAALGSLGLVATEEEHYDESMEWNRAALQLAQSIGDQNSEGKILGIMGWSSSEMGDYERALDLFQQAESVSSHMGSKGDVLYWRLDAGDVYVARQDYSSAESAYLNALEIARSLDDQEALIFCLEDLALVDLELDRLDSAERYHTELAPLVDAHPDHFLTLHALLIAGRIQQARRHFVQAEQIFESVLKDQSGNPSVRWEAQARLAANYAEEGRSVDADREFRQSIQGIEAARASLKEEEFRVSFLTSAIEFYDDYLAFLISQRKSEQALQIAASAQARTLVEGLGVFSPRGSSNVVPANWTQVAQRENAIVLSYWLGPHHSYMWAITPSGALKLLSLPPHDQIDATVRSYSQALLGPRDPMDAASAEGRQLYEMLVAPATHLIPRNARVIIVPDGSLCGLNFETLQVAEPSPHYWIDDVTIANSDSLLLIAAAHKPATLTQGRLLLIGDPVSSSDEFPRLPEAAAEISSVEKYFPQSTTTVLSGAGATPQAYLQSNPAQFSFIHFVTHATSSRARPLESAVVLSKQGDSFKLYGRDVIDHPLKAELVTISACNGVGSRNYSGEGLVGLSWAFLRAGARGVIAALWDVNDTSTATLMDHLYSAMSKGKDPVVALHDAKLSLLHSRTVYQKPFYWAPFQYYIGL